MSAYLENKRYNNNQQNQSAYADTNCTSHFSSPYEQLKRATMADVPKRAIRYCVRGMF